MTENQVRYGTFEQLLEGLSPDIAAICAALRRAIRELDPDCYEVVWLRQGMAGYGVGPRKMTEHYAYLGPFKAHVNLGFYYGTDLPDPEGLLEGAGKRLRHVKVRTVAQAESPAVRELIRAAIAEREQAMQA